MTKRRRNKKSRAWLGSLLILIGASLPLFKYIYFSCLDYQNNDKIENFFEQEEQVDIDLSTEVVEENKTTPSASYDYIAVLEIPSISLKRGLVDKNSKANNVNKNIQILNESDMPDVENGTLYLAGHSGSSYISFFRNLEKVKYGDMIYIYYNHVKYSYKVNSLYIETKDGDISVLRDKNKTNLVLTTCSQDNKGSQFVVISELINQENY